MIIEYGTLDKKVDVTRKVYRELRIGDYIHIPKNDVLRAHIFGDPMWGVVKSVYIDRVEYSHLDDIYIDDEFDEFRVYTSNVPHHIKEIFMDVNYYVNYDYDKKTKDIHKQLKIEYGYLEQEFPEQMMSVRYLQGNEKVLELGGNVGRNSLIIGHILNKYNNSNFVTLECNVDDAKKLEYNRDLNGLKFHIEASALSKRKLIQKEWNTIPCEQSDVLLEGYVQVNTITWNELIDKYKIDFDTLVIDCEGAFYYILQDMPEVLDNIKLIIVENDYFDVNIKDKLNEEQKNYVDDILKKRGFYLDYMNCHIGNYVYNNFYEVWKRD